MHSSIAQNIKSFGSPPSGVQCPASVTKIVTSFMDRSSPNLEHSFYIWCTKRYFEADPCCLGNQFRPHWNLKKTDPCCHGNEDVGILTRN